MKLRPAVAALAALCCAISVSAADATPEKVLLEAPVTYHPNAGVVEKVRTECRIEDLLARRIGAVLDASGSGLDGTLAAGVKAPAAAQVLRVQITHVLGVGGGAWSGPKAITVTAALLEKGRVVRQTKINRWSMGGVFGSFKGTCSILDRSATAIGKDLGRWVRDPSYTVVDEAEPKGAQTESRTKDGEADSPR